MSERNKIDLSKLKEEIEYKKNVGVINQINDNPKFSRNKWLNDLVESRTTGSKNETVQKIEKIVKRSDDVIVDEFGNPKLKPNAPKTVDENYIKHIQQPQTVHREQVQPTYDERDEKMFDRFNKSNKGLYDSINEVVKPMINNNQQQHSNGANSPINEDILHRGIDSYLSKNISPLLEQMMKNVIVETYERERIKKVLKENPEIIEGYINENPKFIEKIIIDTIKKLKARNTEKK